MMTIMNSLHTARQMLRVATGQPPAIGEQYYKRIAERIARDRNGYPILWTPMATGGEAEGAKIERYFVPLGVPYAVVPIRERDRHSGLVTSPTHTEMKEITKAAMHRLGSTGIVAVYVDDSASTALDAAIVLAELYRLKGEGINMEGIKSMVMFDNVGGVADYSMISRRPPVFSNTGEMMALFRQYEDKTDFSAEVLRRTGLELPPDSREIVTRLMEESAQRERMLAALGEIGR
ncbi:MAG: hypothetical protein HY365_02080 [Candidatus Aenigmarchaeota archaeon]|nr:hypothetical protein [Candidatus Aenigmarchaeota archaeon]